MKLLRETDNMSSKNHADVLHSLQGLQSVCVEMKEKSKYALGNIQWHLVQGNKIMP